MADKQFNVNVVKGTITIVTSDTVTTGTVSHVINGLARWTEWLTADMQDSDSTLIDVISPAGGSVFSSGTVAESTRFSIGSVYPLQGTWEIVATAEGTQDAAREIPYEIYYTT